MKPKTPARQRGVSMIPAILILTILFVLSAAYFGLVLPNQTRRISGLLKGTASTNLAETGLNQAMSLLLSKPNLAQILSTEPGFTSKNSHAIVVSRLVSNPVNPTGTPLGQVDWTIDSGDPATGGHDAYNNAIWFDATQKNFDATSGMYRFGVTAYGTPFTKEGAAATATGLRGVYAVVSIPGTVAPGEVSPSIFFLHTTADLSIAGGSTWYGPIDTDGTIHFWWDPSHNSPTRIFANVTYAAADPTYTQYPSNNSSNGVTLDPALTLDNPAYFNWGSGPTPDTTLQPKHMAAKTHLSIDIVAVRALTNANCGVVSDPDNGCYVGDQDFQNTYFGPPGLTIGGTAINSGDIVYIGPNMDVQLTWDPTHLAYFYRPIPPNGALLVVNGTVSLGGSATGPSAGFSGPATIINGRMSIISYTDQAQNDSALAAPGNIVIYGNVVYRNPIDVNDPSSGRQVDPGTNPPQFITNADGSPTGTGTVDALGLFASQYVWVYVPNLYQPLLGQQDYPDNVQIFGQIIAGAAANSTATLKNYYPPLTNPKYKSFVDQLTLYGAVSAAGSPELDYFSQRTYYFDRSLGHPGNPRLPGLPTFSGGGNPGGGNTGGTPRVVSGTWREITK